VGAINRYLYKIMTNPVYYNKVREDLSRLINVSGIRVPGVPRRQKNWKKDKKPPDTGSAF
jgi:hypothetical protein